MESTWSNGFCHMPNVNVLCVTESTDNSLHVDTILDWVNEEKALSQKVNALSHLKTVTRDTSKTKPQNRCMEVVMTSPISNSTSLTAPLTTALRHHMMVSRSFMICRVIGSVKAGVLFIRQQHVSLINIPSESWQQTSQWSEPEWQRLWNLTMTLTNMH